MSMTMIDNQIIKKLPSWLAGDAWKSDELTLIAKDSKVLLLSDDSLEYINTKDEATTSQLYLSYNLYILLVKTGCTRTVYRISKLEENVLELEIRPLDSVEPPRSTRLLEDDEARSTRLLEDDEPLAGNEPLASNEPLTSVTPAYKSYVLRKDI